ncbi:MAG: DUF1501 domain-containing protein [Pseudomonadota bacterium]
MTMNSNRRDFLRNMLAASMGSASLLGSLGWASTAQAAATLAGPNDYRGLVTVFLFGGNDSFNTVVPLDSRYSQYAQARGPLAIPQSDLLSLGTTGLGLHPAMPGLHSLFNQGRVAVGSNVGPLLEPVTREGFLAGSAKVPPQLFSHEQQQVHWQTAEPASLARRGWLGRANDLLETAYPDQDLPFGISMLGSNTLQVGNITNAYAVGPEGPPALVIRELDESLGPIHDRLLAREQSHPLMAEHGRLRRRSIDIYERYAVGFETVPNIQTPFPANGLAQQLLGVARYMAVSQQLGIRRQNFFVGFGGFDTHASQLTTHPQLLAALDQAITAFYNATIELGLVDQVTLTTLSEFGRTLSINGDGTDHGWGGHQFAVGGPVQGGLVGQFPELAIEGPDDAGEGRLIPTMATEQFMAPLMEWFGVSGADLNLVFPNLSRFDTPVNYMS